MRANYPLIMKWLAEYEGGYVDHPKDPGGATNRGVTQRVYDAYRIRAGKAKQTVALLTDAEHDQIYLRNYWMPVRGDELPSGVDASVFDMAVHSGVSRAVRTLQSALGVKPDGIIGEITMAALEIERRRGAIGPLIYDINARRMAFLKRLRHWPTFKRGWTRRVMGQKENAQDDDIGVLDRSLALARGNVTPKPPRKFGNSSIRKAEEKDTRWISAIIEAIAGIFRAIFAKGK